MAFSKLERKLCNYHHTVILKTLITLQKTPILIKLSLPFPLLTQTLATTHLPVSVDLTTLDIPLCLASFRYHMSAKCTHAAAYISPAFPFMDE